MESKKCTTCGISKELSEFSTNGKSNNRTLYRSACKKCRAKCMIEYRQLNPEQIKESLRKFSAKKPKAVKPTSRTKEQLKIYQKERQYKWRKENAEKYKRYNREYATKNNCNPYNRMIHSTRTAIHRILNSMGRTKHQKSEKLLGYTFENLWARLSDDINWHVNSGIKYNIDHRIPSSWFKEVTPVSMVHDLRNLQIISEDKNLEKQNFYPSILEPGDENYLIEIKDFIRPEYSFF